MKILERIEALETHVKDELENIRKEMRDNIHHVFVDEWPKEHDRYFIITEIGDILPVVWDGFSCDLSRKEIGNCFRTREEAEHKAARDRAVAEWNRLAGNKDWINWKVDGQEKWYPYLSDGEVKCSWCADCQHWPYAYFKNNEECQAAIDKMGPEKMKLLFEGC